MKILLDNCVDRRVAPAPVGHAVHHTSRVGLSTAQNGQLLESAAALGFQLLITVDQKIRHEQNLEKLPIAILELDTRDARLAALLLMAPHLEAAIAETSQFLFVSLDQAGQLTRLAPRAIA